jgi:hypothetical protein
MKFYVTKHAQQRYLERIHNNLNVSDNLLKDMLDILYKAKDITSKIYDNIPRYILYLYETYKTVNCKILESENVIFLCKKREGTEQLYDVITCYHKNANHLSQFENTVLSRKEIFIKIAEIKRKLKK